MVKNIANIITGGRILGSILLLFFPVLSWVFLITYLLCGFSDMIDGTIARKTNSNSNVGAKIDTVADLTFITAALIKMLPVIHCPGWLWIWGGVVAFIKIANVVWGYFSKKQFIALHTKMNKLTGLFMFLLPLTLSFIELKYSAAIVCAIATIAAIQETAYIATNYENK